MPETKPAKPDETKVATDIVILIGDVLFHPPIHLAETLRECARLTVEAEAATK